MPARLATSGARCRLALRHALVVATAVGCVRPPAPVRTAPTPHPAALAPAAQPVMTARSASAEAMAGTAGRVSTRDALRAALAGTYLSDVLSVQNYEVVRWPEHLRTPLRVWVGEGAKLDGWRPTFPAMVRDAFTTWTDLGIPVRVVFVRDSAAADVKVSFVERFEADVSGRTTWQYNNDGEIRAGRTTLSTRRADGVRRTDAQLRAVALHEVGHALGLQHAKADPTSIMSPRVDVLDLSQTDKATVRLLYSLPAGKLE